MWLFSYYDNRNQDSIYFAHVLTSSYYISSSISVNFLHIDTTVVKFAPDAFLDPYEYFGTDETKASIALLTDDMMGRAGGETYSKLRGGIRDTVVATWRTENLWTNGKAELSQYLIKRYIGTGDGVFRETPGDVLSKGYDPRRRPWYVM